MGSRNITMALGMTLLAAFAGLAAEPAPGKVTPEQAPAPAPKVTPNPKIAAITEGHWARVADKVPTSTQMGIFAYSGAAFDATSNAYLVFGGGHNDYWGNEIWKLDMAALRWERMYEPSKYGRLDNVHGCVEGDDKPYTRHTYNQLVYVPTIDEMLLWGGFGPTCYPNEFKPGGKQHTSPMPKDTWTYSLKQNKWTLRCSPDKGGRGLAGACGGTAYDSKRDLVWALVGQGRPALQSFDFKTNNWTAHKVVPQDRSKDPAGMAGALVHVPARDLLVSKSGWIFAPGDGDVSAEKAEALSPGEGGSMVLLTGNGVLLGVKENIATYFFDFDSKRWVEVPCVVDGGKDKMLQRDANGKVSLHGFYGRLQYSPIDHAVILAINTGVWAYKPLKEYTPDNAVKASGGNK